MADYYQEGRMGIYFGWLTGFSGFGQQMSSNLVKLGTLSQIGVISRAVTTPPLTPSNGDCYIVPPGALTLWLGQTGKIAVYRSDLPGGAWQFFTAPEGSTAVILDEGTWGTLSVWKGGSWSPGTALS